MNARTALFLIIAMAALAGCAPRPPITPTVPEGAVAILTPERENVEYGQDESQLAQVIASVNIHAGEWIRITQGGEAILDFGQALRLRLFNDTEMQTVSAAPAADAAGAAYVLSLQQGGLSGRLAGTGETATIETPGGATITVLGTQFFVVHDSSTGQTTVGNFDGSVEVEDSAGRFALGSSRQVTLPGRTVAPLPVSFQQFEERARTLGPIAAIASLQAGPSPTPTATPPPSPTGTPMPTRTVTPSPTPTGTPAPPDLVVSDFAVVGEPSFAMLATGLAPGRVIQLPVRLTATNRGMLPAPIFQVGVQAQMEAGNVALCFVVKGKENSCFPATDEPLAGRTSYTFEGSVSIPVELAGSTLQLFGEADTCARNARLPVYCQVQESDETNNHFFAPVVELPPPPPPDLIVTGIAKTAEAFRTREGRIAMPVAVTVLNQGGAPAELFKVSTEAITPNGQFLFPFTVSGQESSWYPFTSAPLAPGAAVTFQGIVSFPYDYAGSTVTLLALADSCAGEEFVERWCRVAEGDEENNWSSELRLVLPFFVD